MAVSLAAEGPALVVTEDECDTLLDGLYDGHDALITIWESADSDAEFVLGARLAQMYRVWALRHRYGVTSEPAEVGATVARCADSFSTRLWYLHVRGAYAFGTLARESGEHELRAPVRQRYGMVTGWADVQVTPQLEPFEYQMVEDGDLSWGSDRPPSWR